MRKHLDMHMVINRKVLDKDARKFHETITELIKIYQYRDRHKICCHDISVTQYYAMEALTKNDSITQKQLSELLYLDKSTTSRVVNTLEKKGFICREKDSDDGRTLILHLTEKGGRLFELIEKDSIEELKELLNIYNNDVRQATIELVSRFTKTTNERFMKSGLLRKIKEDKREFLK